MIRVGMVLPLQGMWQGGKNYFGNLLNCCRQYPDPALRLEVFTDRPQDVAQHQCDSIEIHDCPVVSYVGLRGYPRRAVKKLMGYDPLLLKIMERNHIDLVSHHGIGRQSVVNTLQWEPDFQHRIFPQFFSRKNLRRRDEYLTNVVLWGNVLLSSHSAAKDFRRFYPELAWVRTQILHFSSASVLEVEPMIRAELTKQFPVQEPYFHLPNQFWRHKNHAVVVEALRQTRPEIRVICTGPMKDPRDESYVPSLMETVKQAGLEHRFVCLGSVPYRTMVSLMHHSLAVVQPSLFEGWSTTVEESKAMCKRIILSNIDVHVEQAPERGLYFSPDSPQELAAGLERVYAEFDPATEESFVGQRPKYKARIGREMSEHYAAIVKAVSPTVPLSTR
jgi:glycosyltransferase involved in cell wall biosynthesis